MIIYRVTVVIKKDVENFWLEWMIKEHIIDAMKTGYLLECEMQKQLLPEITVDESSYVIRYKSHSFEQ